MSQTYARPRRRWFRLGPRTLFAAVTLLVLFAFLWPTLQSSNCGGNSAALTACRHYATAIQVWQSDHPGEAPNVADLVELPLPGTSWLHAARLLANPNVFPLDAALKQVILVCDRPYNNVPQRPWPLWRAPMAHAVAYSDGTTGLISPDEFADLDVRAFVTLDFAAASPANRLR